MSQADADYNSLREQANEEREIMVKYIEEMKQARAIGDLMLVDELSVRVKRHGKRSKELNERASELIFASAYIFPSMISHGTLIF